MHDVRIHVTLGDIRLEFRGRRAFFERCIEPLLASAVACRASGEEAAAEATPAPAAPSGPSFRPTAPAQFNRFVGQVGERAAGVDQRIMAFAFYLWNFERDDAFSLDQIASFFRTVQDEPPEDLAERVADLAGPRRFVEPTGEDGDWRLTTKGVNYVKNRLLGS